MSPTDIGTSTYHTPDTVGRDTAIGVPIGVGVEVGVFAGVAPLNSIPHPLAIWPMTPEPPKSRTYKLHVPLALMPPKFPLNVCVPVPPTVLPGRLYGPGGA